MHEMIKMSITTLLTALCLRVFPGDQGPVTFHKVFDLVLWTSGRGVGLRLFQYHFYSTKAKGMGSRSDTGDTKRRN